MRQNHSIEMRRQLYTRKPYAYKLFHYIEFKFSLFTDDRIAKFRFGFP